MSKEEAIAYFGSQAALAEALGIRPPSVAEWGEYPPALRQIQLQALTGGKLKAESGLLPAATATQAAA